MIRSFLEMRWTLMAVAVAALAIIAVLALHLAIALVAGMLVYRGGRRLTELLQRACRRRSHPRRLVRPSHAKTVSNRGVFVYFVSVILAVGLLFAITAVPGSPAELFPDPSPEELVQAVQWAWEGAFEKPPMCRTLNEG